MSRQYPNLLELKQELSVLNPSLPVIPALAKTGMFAGNFMHNLYLCKTAELTIRSLSNIAELRNPKIHNFVAWFIQEAYSLVPETIPESIKGYTGVVGPDGQMLNYLHCDAVDLRISATVADMQCPVNPTTLITRQATAQEDVDTIQEHINSRSNAIPKKLLLPQQPEGSIAQFSYGQSHAEQTIPAGIAKIAYFATYKF